MVKGVAAVRGRRKRIEKQKKGKSGRAREGGREKRVGGKRAVLLVHI